MQAQPDAGPMSMIFNIHSFYSDYSCVLFPDTETSAKKAKGKTKKLLNSVKVGDEVITAGGIFGKVDHIEDKILYVKIADNVKSQSH